MLLPNSPNMFNLQDQMACFGYHLECITFNEELWASMVERYKFFWLKCVAPELLTGAMIPTPSQAGAHLEGEQAYAGSQRCKPTLCQWIQSFTGRKVSSCRQVAGCVLLTRLYGGPFLFVTAQHRMHKM